MSVLREWMQRLRGSLVPSRRDSDLEQELRLHLELAAEDARRRGLSSAESARVARLEAGRTSQAMDALRDQRGMPWLDDLIRDARHGVRMLRRTPVFTAVALLTLALGSGANIAIFTIVNGVILRPLDYPRPAQLMFVTSEFPALGSTAHALSAREYLEFRRTNRSFATVGAYRTIGGAYTTGEVNLLEGTRPLRVPSIAVDADLLAALGVQPAEGRFFTRKETDRTGGLAPPLAILSSELWHATFGGRPLIGHAVNIDGRPHQILGILPPGIGLMNHRPAIWLPLSLPAVIREDRSFHILNIVGRLKDGVNTQAAQAELDTCLQDWGECTGSSGHVPTIHPSGAEDHSLRIQPLQDAMIGDIRRSIWILQAAVGCVLLIACANLASLLIARAESRRRELAVRAALGAGRGRLLRQAMTEGVMLGLAGGMLGLWLARVAVQALKRAYPASVPG